MTKELPIVVPSHRRAKDVLTTRAIAHAILCVPATQAAEYREHNPGVELLVHPDTVIGLPMKRQWIHEQVGDVFMADDDVRHMLRRFRLPGRLPPELAWEVIQATARVARQAGAYLFGFAPDANPKNFTDFYPFDPAGYVYGQAFGIFAGSPLRWIDDPDLRTVDDFWISGLNAYHNRIAWKDRRFAFATRPVCKTPGGQAEFRTVEGEARATAALRAYFGSAIQPRRAGRHHSYSHPHQRVLKVPW